MTDTTTKPVGTTLPCEECNSTEHATLAHGGGGATTNGHWDGGAPPKN